MYISYFLCLWPFPPLCLLLPPSFFLLFTPNHFSLPLLLCSIFRFNLVPSFFLSFLLLFSHFYFIPFSFRFIFLRSVLRFFSLSALLIYLDINTPAYFSKNRSLFAFTRTSFATSSSFSWLHNSASVPLVVLLP